MPNFHIPINLDLSRSGSREGHKPLQLGNLLFEPWRKRTSSMLFIRYFTSDKIWFVALNFSHTVNTCQVLYYLISRERFTTSSTQRMCMWQLVPLSISTIRSVYDTWQVINIQNQKEKGFRLSLNTQFSRFSPNIDIKNRESWDAALYNDIIFITCFCLRQYGLVRCCWLTLLKDQYESKSLCLILDCLFSTM